MATTFDRWETDPFFAAAEEVQDSADRMESIHRQWIHEKKELGGDSVAGELQRELRTALGTAKWQLEEFDRAVMLNDEAVLAGEDRRSRHTQFVAAIGDRILEVENSLRESNYGPGRRVLSWVQLDENERDELAFFLSGDRHEGKKGFLVKGENDSIGVDLEVPVCVSNGSLQSDESGLWEVREKMVQVPRAASANGDVGTWAVTINSEGEDTSERSSGEQPCRVPPRILSLSALTSAIESSTHSGWYRNGFGKWRGRHRHDMTESIPLRNDNLSGRINACYERSKSYISDCGEDNYDKQINGCLGSFRRQLQRSLYQLQYGRPIHFILWGTFAIFLIVIFVLHAS